MPGQCPYERKTRREKSLKRLQRCNHFNDFCAMSRKCRIELGGNENRHRQEVKTYEKRHPKNENRFSALFTRMGAKKKLVARILKSEPLILKSKPLIFCPLKNCLKNVRKLQIFKESIPLHRALLYNVLHSCFHYSRHVVLSPVDKFRYDR